MEGERSWELDDPATPMGRRFNEMRRKLIFARQEIERIVSDNPILRSSFTALQNEVAATESELEKNHDSIYALPLVDLKGRNLIQQEDMDLELSLEWMDDLTGIILKTFPEAIQLDHKINVLSEHVPITLQLYLRQLDDTSLQNALLVPQKIIEDMMEKFNLTSNVIIVLSESYMMLELRGLQVDMNQYIVRLPYSKYRDVLGWIPLGHELGHVLFRTRDKDRLTREFYSLVMDYSGPFDTYTLLNSWRWLEELFADAVMIEIFGAAGIMELNSTLALERQQYVVVDLFEILQLFKRISSLQHEDEINEETIKQILSEFDEESVVSPSFESHPSPFLRLSMMLDYLEMRLGQNKGIQILREHFTPEYDAISRADPQPWCNEEFRLRVLQILHSEISPITPPLDLNELKDTIIAIKEKQDLDRFSTIQIISGLSLYHYQQHSKLLGEIEDRPEWVYKTLRDKSDNRI